MSDNNHSSTPFISYYHERGGKQKKQIYDLIKRLKYPKNYKENEPDSVRLTSLQKRMAEKKLRDTKEVKKRKRLKGQIRYCLKTKNNSKDLLDENLSLEEQLKQAMSLPANAKGKEKQKVKTDLQSTPTPVNPENSGKISISALIEQNNAVINDYNGKINNLINQNKGLMILLG